MLRMTIIRGAEEAKSYYLEGDRQSKADYYTKDQEEIGLWGGKGAARLGLADHVEKDNFEAVVDNLHPSGSGDLTAATRSDRRPGYDFNFHAPKGLSIMQAVTGDERIKRAFREAVRETMAELEQFAATRVRKNKAWDDRNTGEIVYAEFVHHTSRPVIDKTTGTPLPPDPHLHVHTVVANATWDPVEHKWKALENRYITEALPYLEAAFHCRLAKKVVDLGYTIERRGKWWDIAAIDRDLVKKYSSRTLEIEAKAKELGIEDARSKDKLGATTRAAKVHDIPYEELVRIWTERLDDADREAFIAATTATKGMTVSVTQAVDFAMEHHFYHKSAVRDLDIIETAMRFGVVDLTQEQITAELYRRDLLTCEDDKGRRYITTPTIYAMEQEVIEFARDGRGTRPPMVGSDHAISNPANFVWNAGQREAIRHVWESTDRLMIIRGGPGTGKSAMLKETVAGLEAHGIKPVILAPTTDASRNTLRNEGFKDAETLKMFLTNSKLQSKARDGLIIIDEASLMGTKDMLEVVHHAKRLNARVLLQGDVKQNNSVQQGDILRVIQKYAIKPVSVTEIVRQSGTYKKAVEAFQDGEIDRGFETLKRIDGAIFEHKDPDVLRQHTASKYADALDDMKRHEKDPAKAALKAAVVMSPVHKEGEEVTTAIRQELKERGHLEGKERKAVYHKDLQWTPADRSDATKYEPGMVIRFNRPQKELGRLKTWHVKEQKDGIVWMENGMGDKKPLPLHKPNSFGVFSSQTIDIAKGDVIQFARNTHTRDGRTRINGGSSYVVTGFTRDGNAKLHTGKVANLKDGNIHHGYYTTSPGGQGRTTKLDIPHVPKASFAALSQNSLLVNLSRGTDEVVVVTDDLEGLKVAAAQSAMRMSATEVVEEGPAIESAKRLQKAQAIQKLYIERRKKQFETPTPQKQKTHQQGPLHDAARRTYQRER